MTSRLSSDQITHMSPLLGSIARMLARGTNVTDEHLRIILDGMDMVDDEVNLSELKRWTRLLGNASHAADETLRQAAVEALLLRGLPEATVLLAVGTAATARNTPESPVIGLDVQPARFDWLLKPGEEGTATLYIGGGPGQVLVDSEQVRVHPTHFGAAMTPVQVRVLPLRQGMVWTSLRLVTATQTKEVPLVAQWEDSSAQVVPEDPTQDVGMPEGELEITRDELIAQLQDVVQRLSIGLQGGERDTYLAADDLAQNEWFFAGVSDEEGQYAITMWPAVGDEDMLRIDIGGEEGVHRLAADPEMLAAMTDDFIEAMDVEESP